MGQYTSTFFRKRFPTPSNHRPDRVAANDSVRVPFCIVKFGIRADSLQAEDRGGKIRRSVGVGNWQLSVLVGLADDLPRTAPVTPAPPASRSACSNNLFTEGSN